MAQRRRYGVSWRDRRGRERRNTVMASSPAEARRHASARVAEFGGTLGGVTASKLWVAEFMIGRGVGIPIGTTFERGHQRCITGLHIKGKTRHSARYGELVTHDDVRSEFLAARAEQLEKPDGVAASIIPAEGAWMGGREPSVLARVYWTPQQEKSRRTFQNNMVSLCQQVACRLSQREVLLRLMRPAKQNLLLRCSPTGASKPR